MRVFRLLIGDDIPVLLDEIKDQYRIVERKAYGRRFEKLADDLEVLMHKITLLYIYIKNIYGYYSELYEQSNSYLFQRLLYGYIKSLMKSSKGDTISFTYADFCKHYNLPPNKKLLKYFNKHLEEVLTELKLKRLNTPINKKYIIKIK